MLKIENVSLERAGRVLFGNLNFSFNEKAYGLVGANGVGKSTLAQLLAGQLEPDTGHVRGSEGVLYVPQFDPEPSRRGHFSGGEAVQRRLTEAFAQDPAFLILDEPTNNLDLKAKDFVLQKIRTNQKGLLVISHDRTLLREVDEIIELTSKGLKRFGGGFDLYWAERSKEKVSAQKRLEDAQSDKRKAERKSREVLSAQTKRNRRGQKHGKSGSLPRIVAGLRKQSAETTTGKIGAAWKDRVKESAEAVLAAQDAIILDPFLRFDFEASALPASKVVVMAEDLNIHFDNEPLWEKPLHFQMRGRERWRISGGNGTGKSTLLKMLIRKQMSTGTLILPSSEFVYLDQDQSLLGDHQSVLETVGETTRFHPTELRNELAFFGFTKDKVHQTVQSLSGGERLRAALAKILLGRQIPQVLLLDEPTNNLDFTSLEMLESALAAYQGLLVIVSHDDAFVETLRIDHELKLD